MNKTMWMTILGLTLCMPALGARPGQGRWNATHPRRHEVNRRLANQNRRINQGVKNGTLTKAQAQQLRSDDRSIRQEERADAAKHGGHITRAEQRQLNRQENRNSRRIYREKHPQATPATPANPGVSPAVPATPPSGN